VGDVGDVALLAEVDCQHVVGEVDDGDESLGHKEDEGELEGLDQHDHGCQGEYGR
jgi:hypothetical protein